MRLACLALHFVIEAPRFAHQVGRRLRGLLSRWVSLGPPRPAVATHLQGFEIRWPNQGHDEGAERRHGATQDYIVLREPRERVDKRRHDLQRHRRPARRPPSSRPGAHRLEQVRECQNFQLVDRLQSRCQGQGDHVRADARRQASRDDRD